MAKTEEVYIISLARTPIGSFRGSLASVPAAKLGAIAIKGAISRAGITADQVNEVFMGHVLQAGIGQHPAKQAAFYAGIPVTVPCQAVNKVCASGMKAIVFGAQSIMLGDNDIVVAGGMESMSNAPYYLQRGETPYGGVNLTDGLVLDGLTNPFDNTHMGLCTEGLAAKWQITRQQQDEFAKMSYTRSAKAAQDGLLAAEIVPVVIPGTRGKPDVTIDQDEEYKKVNFDKFPTLNTVFKRENGTITAANASTLNDGAAACVLASGRAIKQLGIKPLARIVGYADAGVEPVDFGIAPAHAIPKLLEKTGIQKSQISRWEINEAFSAVALANIKSLQLNPEIVNINGGAVSLGHPLGCSGCRIVNSLALHLQPGQYGAAGICNGGGGASSILVQKV